MIAIRKLQPPEWPLYKEVRLLSLHTDPDAYGATLAENLDRPDSYWEERLTASGRDPLQGLWFALAEDRAVGMVAATPREEAHRVHIISMYVAEPWRGQGVSKRLLGALVEEMRALGTIAELSLDVNPAQTAALALYCSLGFQVVKEVVEVRNDGSSFVEFKMRRPLDT